MSKQLLFSLTKEDFDWQFFRAGGKGGQNVNKRDSACRCVHLESGAKGESREERHQHLNRKLAFQRCVETKEFKNWLRLKTSATIAGYADIERYVDKMMKPENIKVEYYDPKI